MNIYHYIGTETGRARCGHNLGYVDHGGEVGGDLPPRTWEVHHVAQSAVRLLGILDQEGSAGVCWECAGLARAALIGPTGDPSVPLYLPPWARDEEAFAERVAGAWPDAVDEAAMSEDEWALRRRPSSWSGGGTIRIEGER